MGERAQYFSHVVWNGNSIFDGALIKPFLERATNWKPSSRLLQKLQAYLQHSRGCFLGGANVQVRGINKQSITKINGAEADQWQTESGCVNLLRQLKELEALPGVRNDKSLKQMQVLIVKSPGLKDRHEVLHDRCVVLYTDAKGFSLALSPLGCWTYWRYMMWGNGPSSSPTFVMALSLGVSCCCHAR